MTIDLDALIAEARERAHAYTGGPEADRLFRLADALEAVSAELRQERERADAEHYAKNRAKNAHLGTKDALSRAEEAIEKALAITDSANISSHHWMLRETRAILTEYDKQKEQSNDQS